MTPDSIRIAVVGHTNTGKTSLLRTLTRDVSFGEVSNRPATTREVQGAVLVIDGRPLIELFDTPGLEDSIALLDHLEQLRAGRRIDGIDLAREFLASPQASPGARFGQEAKALTQLLSSDLALYVIDARDRVLGKHRDELEILSRCARPIVPLLNFVASAEAQTDAWREQLARVNMHAVVEFDTVVLDEHSLRRLIEKARTMLESKAHPLDAWLRHSQAQREQLIGASVALVADLLIDVAAHVVHVPADDSGQAEAATQALRDRVRAREQQCVNELVSLHQFRAEDVATGAGPLVDGRWGLDLFSPAAMKQFSVRTGGGAAAGALAGLTLDAMVGGASLGAATALGAAIGGLAGAVQSHGRRLVERVRGRAELHCNHDTLRLLATRQLWLIAALMRRGHASVEPLRWLSDDRGSASLRRLRPDLDEVRLHPSWSRLQQRTNPVAIASSGRRAVQDRISTKLDRALRSKAVP